MTNIERTLAFLSNQLIKEKAKQAEKDKKKIKNIKKSIKCLKRLEI